MNDYPAAKNRAVYPDAPGYKAAGTSEQAAAAFTEPAKNLRAAVLECITAEPAGLTADEAATRLGRSVLSVRPRVAELHRQGEIIETVERRRNQSGMTATVWRVAVRLETERAP